MRRAARKDGNQQQIVDALRDVGATVAVVNQEGLPDLLVGFRGRNYLMEVKTSTGRIRTLQRQFFQRWQGYVRVVRTVDEALQLIGVV